jgi:hypothetical protein
MSWCYFVTNSIPSDIEEIAQCLVHENYKIVVLYNRDLHEYFGKKGIAHEYPATVNLSTVINNCKNHHAVIIAEEFIDVNDETIEKISFLR